MIELTTVPEPVPTLAQYERRRAIQEFYRRTLAGPVFYAIALALTAWYGGYFERLPHLVWPGLLMFGALGVLRWWHKPPLQWDCDNDAQRWWNVHWLLVHAVCILWCVVFWYTGCTQRYPDLTFFVVVTSTIAFSTASAETFGFAPLHALLTILELQAPALLFFVAYEPELHTLSAVLTVYCVYQTLHIRRRAAEYHHQMEIEHNLLSSRAEVERLSRQDALTGVANRREYETVFEASWHHAARSGTRLSLLVLDLDHFKKINDTYGHAAGDACLRHVADLLMQQFRRGCDLVARIGGEEFVVLLPDTGADDAFAVANDLCALLAANPCVVDGQAIAITASLGTGEVLWSFDTSPQASFRRVDAACYAAKSQGRNRVVAAGLPTETSLPTC